MYTRLTTTEGWTLTVITGQEKAERLPQTIEMDEILEKTSHIDFEKGTIALNLLSDDGYTIPAYLSGPSYEELAEKAADFKTVEALNIGLPIRLLFNEETGHMTPKDEIDKWVHEQVAAQVVDGDDSKYITRYQCLINPSSVEKLEDNGAYRIIHLSNEDKIYTGTELTDLINTLQGVDLPDMAERLSKLTEEDLKKSLKDFGDNEAKLGKNAPLEGKPVIIKRPKKPGPR